MIARSARVHRTTALAGLTAFLIVPLAAIGADSSALLEAAKSGQRAAALALLREGVEPSAVGPDGTTALHWATQHDDRDLIAALLAAGADPRAANRYGITPLFLAAQNGSVDAIEQLLDAGADPNEVGTEGETVLMTAARTGSTQALDLLLRRGADIDAREQWHGQTALMWAAGFGHAPAIATLLEHGADVNAVSAIEEWERQTTAEPRAKWLPPGGLTALLFAAREGCLDCIPALVAGGANVDQTTPDGISGIVLALINGHYDAAAALIEAGTDVNLLDYTGRGALYAATDFSTMPSSNRPAPHVIENEHSALDIIELLIRHGADVNAQLERQAPLRAKLDRGNDTALGGGTTALMRAAKAADLPAMRVLLEAGADVTLTTERGGADALLLAAGVGTTEQDTTGRHKTEADAIAAIEILVEHGADLHVVDARGRNAAHGAALQGYNDVLRFLAAGGVDMAAADQDGHTPLDTALGLAGGFGFSGDEGVVREDSARLIRELLANQ